MGVLMLHNILESVAISNFNPGVNIQFDSENAALAHVMDQPDPRRITLLHLLSV
jgi:hypothetical protein